MAILPPSSPAVPGSSVSATDLIASAMRNCGVLESGEQPTGAELNDGLVTLNQMMDAWSIERLMVFTVQRNGPYALTSGQAAYTLGPAPAGPLLYNLTQERPSKIQSVSIINQPNSVQPLELPIEVLDEYGWASIPVKNIGSAIPNKVWDDGGMPYRTFTFWPYPTTANQVVIYAWGILQKFVNVQTRYTFPPGYYEALRYNLAVRLAAEFGVKELNPVVAVMALESKGKVETINAPLLELRCDSALTSPKGGVYNWMTDGPVSRG